MGVWRCWSCAGQGEKVAPVCGSRFGDRAWLARTERGVSRTWWRLEIERRSWDRVGSVVRIWKSVVVSPSPGVWSWDECSFEFLET
jgi:hypothetical protein